MKDLLGGAFPQDVGPRGTGGFVSISQEPGRDGDCLSCLTVPLNSESSAVRASTPPWGIWRGTVLYCPGNQPLLARFNVPLFSNSSFYLDPRQIDDLSN